MSHGFRALALAVALLPNAAFAYVLGDDFQVYTVGQPPRPWLNAGLLIVPAPPVAPTSPTVQTVTNAMGVPTKALRSTLQEATASGIVQPIPVSGRYEVTVDVRIEQLSFPTRSDVIDFPVQIAFVKSGGDVYDLYTAPQVGPYVSSHTGKWQLYLKRANAPLTISDIDLQADEPEVNRWYRVAFHLDRMTGAYTTAITDLASGQPVPCTACNGSFGGWNATANAYDAVAVFDAEKTDVETLNVSYVDNVSVGTFAAPATSGGGSCGLGPELVLLAPLFTRGRRGGRHAVRRARAAERG